MQIFSVLLSPIIVHFVSGKKAIPMKRIGGSGNFKQNCCPSIGYNPPHTKFMKIMDNVGCNRRFFSSIIIIGVSLYYKYHIHLLNNFIAPTLDGF